MTRTADIQMDELIVVRDQASALIRAEVRAGEQREQLEKAVRESILKLGKSIDDVSEASGLCPDEIHKILETVPELTLSDIAG